VRPATHRNSTSPRRCPPERLSLARLLPGGCLLDSLAGTGPLRARWALCPELVGHLSWKSPLPRLVERPKAWHMTH
jgi:hypothetical protein